MKHIIKNSFLSVSVDSFGAELQSIKKVNDELEYLWSGDSKYWARKAPVLFPFVGRLLDDEYEYNNKTYKVNQHGFARDKEFVLDKKEEDYISFKFESSLDTKKNYPFDFHLYISYRLEKNKIIVSYGVQNKSNENIYFSIGAHPAFNWPLDEGEKEDYYFEFESLENLNSYVLDNGYISKSKKDIKLNNNKLYLSEKTFKDDAIILDDFKVKSVLYKSNISKRSIKIEFDDFEYLGLWSKVEGSPFVCIEPWCGLADFIGHNKSLKDKIGIKNLEKDKKFNSSFKIKID